MIFEPEIPIDDNFLDLVKRMKSVMKRNPSMRWIKDKSIWVLSTCDWMSVPVYVSYNWINKNKYEVFTEDQFIGDYSTAKQAMNNLQLLKFIEEKVSSEIIEFLDITLRDPRATMKEAVILAAKDPDIKISNIEMTILGIDEKLSGFVYGKRFGI